MQDLAWKTSCKQWTIETGGERVRKIRYDDDDFNIIYIYFLNGKKNKEITIEHSSAKHIYMGVSLCVSLCVSFIRPQTH